MKIKFWGVRGSIPTPERRNSRYGGNTACVEVRLDNGTLIILDCGSGLRSLGRSLEREFADTPLCCHVFLTHFHWDHIQGAPFFTPLYKEGNEFFFYSIRRGEKELKAAIEGQMINPYFPVDTSLLRSTRHFYDLDYDPIGINSAVVIRPAPLNHPQGCAGYRIEADGGVFVFATDNEPGSTFHDRSIRDLSQGADLLIYDAQYSPEQLQGERKGWGHSSWLEGTRIAKECGVEHLLLFHHDPDHDDAAVDALVERSRQDFSHTVGAAEGLEIELPSAKLRDGYQGTISERRQSPRFRLDVPVNLTWREQNGGKQQARGIALDMSRSGIFFLLPNSVPVGRSLELELTLPNEITHAGDLTLHCAAEVVRQEGNHRSITPETESRGIAGRLTSLKTQSRSRVA